MVKKLIRQGLKTTILLALKEGYLFLRNLLGLFYHPFKTVRVIARERDYSQATLIFGLPFYTFLAGLIFIVGLRFLIQAPPQWGSLAKLLLSLLSLISLIVFIYLFYWLLVFFKLKKKQNHGLGRS